jgi:DNA-binding transcriptional MerR regulator
LDQSFYQTGQFATLAGISVRTLRYYDQVGLLKPTAHSLAGHRLYTDEDLLKLQRILALKFLGFSLVQIQDFLRVGPADSAESLRLQKKMMLEKRQHLDKVILAIDQAYAISRGQPEPDWSSLLEVIRVVQMERDFWKKYYSEEAIKKLEERQKAYTEADAQRDAHRWEAVLSGFRQAFEQGLDPDSKEVQALAGQHQELIQGFTQGDPDIAQGLDKLYAAPDTPFPSPYSSKEEEEYVARALAIYDQRNS